MDVVGGWWETLDVFEDKEHWEDIFVLWSVLD